MKAKKRERIATSLAILIFLIISFFPLSLIIYVSIHFAWLYILVLWLFMSIWHSSEDKKKVEKKNFTTKLNELAKTKIK